MHTPSQQKSHPASTKNKQPVAQLMTLTLSLVGYGLVSSRSHAAVSTPLTCDVNTSLTINSSYGNDTTCTITYSGSVLIENNGSLLNYADFGDLTNEGFLGTYSYGPGSQASLFNYGTLTNSGYLDNYSSYSGISTLTNSLGAELVNDGHLFNKSYEGGNSTLTNSGTLTNDNYLYNDSEGAGSASTLTNNLGAELTNDGYLYNRSYASGTATMTNSGTLTNNYYLYNKSEDTGSTSTLTNTLGAELVNDGHLYNRSDYGGKSNLTNEGTLVNSHSLYNESDGVGSSSTLTNSLGASLTNDGDLYNTSVAGGTSTLNNSGSLINNGYFYNDANITNSGTFDNTTGSLLYNQGSFVQTAGSLVVNGDFYGSGTVDIQGGSLSGAGSIEASSISIGENATVNPGNSPGTLIMVGQVDMMGTLATEIMSSTVYDMLEVQGTISLYDTSTFDFTFDSGYIAVDGDAFDFLAAYEFDFGLGADFASWFDPSQFSVTGLATGFSWSVSFSESLVNTDFSYMWLNVFDTGAVGKPVSAPTTISLFGLAITLIGLSNRRRKTLRALSA